MVDRDPPSNSSSAMLDSASRRRIMVDRQIRTFNVTDQAVIGRMLELPREIFLPADLAALAYCDGQLRLAGREPGVVRTLVAPLVLARLIQESTLSYSDRVLVVGDGPGYAAALVAGLSASVAALESDPAFTAGAREACAKLAIDNVKAVTGPLAAGYLPAAPHDVIFVLGVIEAEPTELYAQLSDRGRLMTFHKPPGDPAGRAAKAVRVTRVGSEFCPRSLFDAAASVLDPFRAKPVFMF